MIEFVFLDAGGTLIDPYPSVGAVYARVGQAFGLDADEAALNAAFAAVWRDARAAEGARMMTFGRDEPATHAFWRGLVFEVLDTVGFTGDREGCFRGFFDAFADPGAWRVYPDVAPLLAGLAARGLPAGVLSNWDFRLPPLLTRLGLAPRLDPLVVSCFEGVAKPDPELYRRAAARVGVPPERILYVGDHRSLDLAPALEVGFEAYLIRRGRAEVDPRVVRSLTELLDKVPGVTD
jgi:putative hydrolase of the HAD superfamily